MLSVGIAHQNGSTVPVLTTDAPPVLEPALLQQALDLLAGRIGLV